MSGICLFCQESLSVPELLAHMKRGHGFDLQGIKKDLDFYKAVMLINCLRKMKEDSICYRCLKVQTSLGSHVSKCDADLNLITFDNDQYLKPWLENDALLYEGELDCNID